MSASTIERSQVGDLAALATFGVGYVARPLGAIVLGHLGDLADIRGRAQLARGLQETSRGVQFRYE